MTPVSAAEPCPPGWTRAGGAPDPALFARAASRGVRAEWCEKYDAQGHSRRSGPYRERYADGSLRAVTTYADSRLDGPVVAYHADGTLFLRGRLRAGAWSGRLDLFHADGETVWLETHFREGVLHGPARTRYPDGALASETRYQRGREDGPARSYYPSVLGGGRRSETLVEADLPVGPQRIFAPDGALRRRLDATAPPAAWAGPHAERPATHAPAASPAPPESGSNVER